MSGGLTAGYSADSGVRPSVGVNLTPVTSTGRSEAVIGPQGRSGTY